MLTRGWGIGQHCAGGKASLNNVLPQRAQRGACSIQGQLVQRLHAFRRF